MIKKSILRILILITLFTTGFLGIFAIPVDNSDSWYTDLFISKIGAVISFWLFSRLYRKWKVSDPWIRAYDKWNDESLHAETSE